ncbi:MAG: hypothetical protein AB1394_17410, partial [Bacteroidota bacterium]
METKRNIRKLVATALCVFLILTFVSVGAAAEGKGGVFGRPGAVEVLFERAEITDKTILLERAKAGITDYNFTNKRKSTVKNPLTGEIEELETVDTTQLLSVKRNPDGSIDVDRSTTTIGLLSSYSRTRDNNYYPGYSVYVYSTIYWTETNCGCHGQKHIKLTQATGAYQRLDSQVTITNRNTRTAQFGTGCFGTANYTAFSTASSFTHNVPSGQPAVNTWSDLNNVGCNMSCRVTRGSQHWDVDVYNM